jgi:serine/threonine protein kinase
VKNVSSSVLYADGMSTAHTRRDELAVGDALGPYRLQELVGEGGMGLVFRAVREPDGETVALKLLKLDFCEDAVYRRRFVHEARAASAVLHPHLVSILEAGEHDERPYLAVAYVAGRTLAERIATDGPLPLDSVRRVAVELGSALDALHDADLVHRDVKSSNVLLRADDGAALLTDFGLAKGRAYTVLTNRGQVLGTIDYLAPELIRGEPATAATDVYAFGCVLYECLTGHTPFGDRAVLQIGLAHLDEPPPDPCAARRDCPAALAGALLRALVKEPERRPASAGEVARAVAAAT